MLETGLLEPGLEDANHHGAQHHIDGQLNEEIEADQAQEDVRHQVDGAAAGIPKDKLRPEKSR